MGEAFVISLLVLISLDSVVIFFPIMYNKPRVVCYDRPKPRQVPQHIAKPGRVIRGAVTRVIAV